MPYKPRILIVDDEPDIGEFISDVAVDVGFDAVTIHTTEKFEEILSTGFDLLVLDLVMPGRDGVELLRTMAERHTAVRVILISGFDSGVLHSAQKLAIEHGLNVIATLNKPIIHEELEQLLGNLAPSSEGFHSGGIELRELPGTDELQKALTQGEFELYYQPQLNMSNGSMSGVEALIRWNHPERGLLMPNIIIPLAEQAEMMDELTAEVIDQSFKQLDIWHGQGLHTQVSINIPVDSLNELGFPELISNKIEHYQLQPEQVALEITETGLMQDLAKSLDVLTRLRIKGV
ncbi:MAG: EAL domain-containing protein, partial [Gammaproteobacteria bacterium]|nr:EAL domain-containing protein [Gammaproteobacteria bacterium]